MGDQEESKGLTQFAGNNKLIFCQSQMIEMAEVYLNQHVFKKRVTVAAVKKDSRDETYEIRLEGDTS